MTTGCRVLRGFGLAAAVLGWLLIACGGVFVGAIAVVTGSIMFNLDWDRI